MFRFVTKEEYWQVEDSGLLDKLPRAPFGWHMKNIQDAMAFSLLRSCRGQTIAEVGGGDSRLLPALAAHNRCVNIEPYEGIGCGPKTNTLPDSITNIPAYLGRTRQSIRDETFDVVFSISVLEHVPDEELEGFLQDAARISKKGGLGLHLIDVYTSESPPSALVERQRRTGDIFFSHFTPLSEDLLGQDGDWRKDLIFRCSCATNPDDAMNRWNHIAPSLRHIRATHQSCSLILAGRAK
ncbi:MAG: class I SAM-dependent methyltransferase [Desulfovibrio sp.]|jgi:hypothetical protein|nr:class I SAM-dependent methyltransferase [Desulfovibrio sp.]